MRFVSKRFVPRFAFSTVNTICSVVLAGETRNFQLIVAIVVAPETTAPLRAEYP